ncbi:AAA family ATPase [Candidatus Woesearchaeota archaeon]|nr:AAA family ATPase [Candidatus Woesearchaeota archaeon]
MSFVIGLVGYSNSGKGTYSHFVKRDLKIPSLSTGDIVRAEVKRRDLELTVENIARVSDKIREETNNHFMDIAKPYIEKLLVDNQVIVVDSLRELADKQSIKSCASGLITIGIYADRDIRYNRTVLRGREGDPLTLEAFLELEDRERALGTDELLITVDARISNNGNLRDFYRESIATTKKILGDRGINV